MGERRVKHPILREGGIQFQNYVTSKSHHSNLSNSSETIQFVEKFDTIAEAERLIERYIENQIKTIQKLL